MDEPKRLSVEEVRQKVTSGEALLVCAYDDEEKFSRLHLEGAISLSDFNTMLPALPKDKEIVFYCA
ncbi:MAG: rhodanese-like domain-containing protein [Candidatus Mariimomonas ferrooxydans]